MGMLGGPPAGAAKYDKDLSSHFEGGWVCVGVTQNHPQNTTVFEHISEFKGKWGSESKNKKNMVLKMLMEGRK